MTNVRCDGPCALRTLAVASIVSASLSILPCVAMAQAYPSKPVRILVPFAAGSSPDLVARLVAEKASSSLGQPFISENRPGAGGRIAADAAARAAPDGYTLLLGTSTTHVIAPHMVKTMPYDPFRDFTPISIAAMPISGFVVHSSVPVNSVKELVQYAKANPGKLAYGSNGIGSSHHLAGELVKMAAGIDMLHVPLAGSNEVLAAVVANQVQVSFSTPGPAKQFITSGRVKLLATVPPKRDPSNPDTPTLAEALPGFEPIADWFGFFGPAKLPPAIVNVINAEVVKAVNAPDNRTRFTNASLLVVGSTPEEFAETMKREYPVYAKIVKLANVPMQ